MSIFNLKNQTHKKLVAYKWIGNGLSLIFLVIIPIIIIFTRYKLFKIQPETTIPGYAIICLLIVAVMLIKWLSKSIKILMALDPLKITIKERYLISILNMIKKLIFPISAILFILLTLDNIHYSAMTVMYMSISMSISIIIDGVFTDVIKSILLVDISVLSENELLERRNIVNTN